MLSESPSISFSSTIPHPALQVIQAANAPRSLFQTFIAKQSCLPQSQPHMMEGCLYSLNWATTWLDFWTDLIATKMIFMLCNYLQGCILHYIKEIHLGPWSLKHGRLNGQSQSVHKIDENFVLNCTLYLKNSYFSHYKLCVLFPTHLQDRELWPQIYIYSISLPIEWRQIWHTFLLAQPQAWHTSLKSQHIKTA